MDSRTIHRRTLFVTAFLALAFTALSARIVYVQVVMHDEFATKARSQRMFTEVVPAKRGRIFDRHGEPLVENQIVRNLVADRQHMLDLFVCRQAVACAEGLRLSQVAERFDDSDVKRRYVDIAVETLAPFVGDEAEFVRAVADGSAKKTYAVISRAIPFQKAESIRKALREKRVRGFSFEDGSRRVYPNPGRLAQVIGIANAENIAELNEGLERTLNEQLAGQPGYRTLERARRSSELLSEHAEQVAPKHGADVALTIDMGLQCIVERHLEDAVAKFSPEKIMAVFIDPMTGEILAMASRPHFDQSTREGERKIHPIAHRYEPGSTFKIIALASAFDQGLVTADSMFFCHNGLYRDGPIRLRDHSSYAYLTTTGILAKSSNIGAYLVAKQVGRHAMYDYIRNFGFGAKTGVALTGEAAGQVIKPDSQWWSKTSLSRIAMGYEVDVTALQMVNALAAIANGGNLMKPQIIRSVTTADGELLYKFSPKKIRRVVSEEAANEVRKALMEVVAEGGTGTKGAVEGFLSGGKTGTAQKPKADRSKGYHKGRYVVSFMSFLPAENPRLAGIIVVDDPQRRPGISIYGGSIAAPIFSAIASEAMPYMGIKPSVVPRRAARSLPRTAAVEAELY